jgi:Peptidase family M28/PDZ domain
MSSKTPRPTGRAGATGLLAGLAGLLTLSTVAAQPKPARSDRAAGADSVRIRADIAYLADDRLEGRLTGSPGNDSAAAYIVRRFRALGLQPIVVDPTDSARCASVRTTLGPSAVRDHGPSAGADEPPRRCGLSFEQRFVARVQAFAHAGRPFELPTRNVVALVPGRDPALRGQVLVLGAHYDHLGRDRTWAQDPAAGDAIRNGADDNASGTAAVMELARLVAAHPLKRSVVVVAFSGEEEGTLGSQWFVDHSPVPLDSVVAMLNFDMVGRLTNDRLLVYGVGTAKELPGMIDTANARGPRLAIKTLPDGVGPSDHAPFYLKDLPVLHFFTDQHADYHAATDDVERINAGGEARVVDLALAVARTIGDRPARLTFTRTAPPRTAMGPESATGVRPYLGSVPDMSADSAGGLRLSGVTPGSPADVGGLRAGDVIVQFGDKAVTDLYSYTDALYAHKPGDVVSVVVLRRASAGAAPERLTLSVTLGRRGE